MVNSKKENSNPVYITNSYDDDISRGSVSYKENWHKFGEAKIGDSITTIWSGASSLQPGLYVYPNYMLLYFFSG